MNAAFCVILFLLSFHFKKKLIYQLLSIIILLLLLSLLSSSLTLFQSLFLFLRFAIFVILLSHYKI